MNKIKSLLLGSAAGLVAIAGAQAADLPVKAKAVEYVKVCSLYGAGFYYIPGTDTCLKVGGYVRADYRVNANLGPGFVGQTNAVGAPWAVPQVYNRAFNYYGTNVRAAVTLDARSQTAYGTLRSYAQFGINSVGAGGGVAAPLGATPYIQFAYIQFAGFTFGNTVSFFDIYGITPFHLNHSPTIDGGTGAYGSNVLAYTAQFGNGVSASISLEDPNPRRPGVFGSNGAALVLVNSTKGVNFPDLVANIKIQQAWGWAQLSGALHDASGTWFGPAGAGAFSPLNVATSNNIGWAIAAGGFFKIPNTAGDTFGIQVSYGHGATGYVTNGVGYNFIRDSQQTFGIVTDAVFSNAAIAGTGVAAGATELTESWAIQVGYEHVWQPGLKSSIAGGYNAVNYNANATNIICTAALAAAGCNPDHSWYQIGSKTTWTPVANLDLSVDVMYTRLNGMSYAAAQVANPAIGGSGTNAGLTGAGIWSGMFRAQRNFWP